MAVVEVANTTYHIDDKIKVKWDRIKDGKLARDDDDRVFIVDGRERVGKSLFALQQACYIDPTLVGDLSRVCFTADEFLSAIRKTNSNKEQTKCIIFDEAFRGLASRAAMSKINKKIIQSMMEVGQKNLVIWIVLPSFFMLDLYPAMLRSDALFHIKKDLRNKRRSFAVYNRKKKGRLYQEGVRKGWTYAIRTRFIGRFSKQFPGGEIFEKNYRAKKYQSLVQSENDSKELATENRFVIQRDMAIDLICEKLGLSLRKAEEFFKQNGITISNQAISVIRKHAAKYRKDKKDYPYDEDIARLTEQNALLPTAQQV